MAQQTPALKHTTQGRLARWPHIVALPVFAVALGLYWLTLAPTVVTMFDDSLEFQLVTYQLGIAHPTGYPLYTLLGWLFTRLPIGDVAYRVNLMSAVFGAATVALVYLIGLELTSPEEMHNDGTRPPYTRVLAALIGALALAVSSVFWSQATVAEVYTLNAAFAAGILWLLVRRKQQGTSQTHIAFDKSLLALFFLFGLSLTHHRTAILLLPAIVFFLWRQSSNWRNRPHLSGKRLQAGVKLAAAFVAPLLLYLYIPLRGHIGSLDGTYTNTLGGFWQHVTASGYGVFIFQNPFGAERGVDFYFSMLLKQFGFVGLIAGLVGLATTPRRDARNLLGILFVSYLAFNLFYHVADIQVFFIPIFLIWAIWVGVTADWLLNGRKSTSTSRQSWLLRSMSLVAVLLLAGQSIILLRGNLPILDRSNNWSVHDYGQDVMHQPLEPNAAIVGILGEVTLVRYFQITEGQRLDLLPIAADEETERLAIVDRLIDQGQAVYLTRELPGAPAQWSLSAVGPLIRVNPQPILNAPNVPILAGSKLIPEIALHGYGISRPSTHEGQSPVRLSLTWQVIAPINRELKVSARLYHPTALSESGGQPMAQADAVPVHFAYPTTAWRAGEFITDVYDLPLVSDFQPGEYIPLVILYDPAQGATQVGQTSLTTVYLP
jgi:hypothetical protein